MATAHDEGSEHSSVAAWAASGAMALTGPADAAPLGPPAALVPRLQAVGDVLARRSGELGRAVDLDPLTMLGERAAISGLHRQGRISCGGATRLLRAEDGWIAVALPRDEDIGLVPAWLGIDVGDEPDAVWRAVSERVRGTKLRPLVEQATLLALPVAALPSDAGATRPASAESVLPCAAHRLGDESPAGSTDEVVVADLSSLWAGPLCGSLLAQAGARVIKVESTQRPDGARRGPRAFFDLVNAGKRSVALDFGSATGRTALRALLERADVVIEASRPRALEQLGIDAETLLTTARTRVWVSITGHGRRGDDQHRVAYGDDAAVAGGLVCWRDGEPYFCADAVADPATGLVAAAAALDALGRGGRWLLDIPLAGVSRHLAGPTLDASADVAVTPPSARAPSDSGPEFGEHTAVVLAELGIG